MGILQCHLLSLHFLPSPPHPDSPFRGCHGIKTETFPEKGSVLTTLPIHILKMFLKLPHCLIFTFSKRKLIFQLKKIVCCCQVTVIKFMKTTGVEIQTRSFTTTQMQHSHILLFYFQLVKHSEILFYRNLKWQHFRNCKPFQRMEKRFSQRR